MADESLKRALHRLKEETRDLHGEAERHVRILDDGATDATYTRFLARMLGFHAPMEDAFARHPALAAAGFDGPSRRKADLLRKDLSHLGLDASAFPMCTDLPDIRGLARAVGAAYVLEGSTLGGAFILTRMRPRFAHLIGPATAFLEGYRAETGSMWRQFVALVGAVIVDDEMGDAAVDAARATFAKLIAWLDEPGADPPHPYWRPGSARRAAFELGS